MAKRLAIIIPLILVLAFGGVYLAWRNQPTGPGLIPYLKSQKPVKVVKEGKETIYIYVVKGPYLETVGKVDKEVMQIEGFQLGGLKTRDYGSGMGTGSTADFRREEEGIGLTAIEMFQGVYRDGKEGAGVYCLTEEEKAHMTIFAHIVMTPLDNMMSGIFGPR